MFDKAGVIYGKVHLTGAFQTEDKAFFQCLSYTQVGHTPTPTQAHAHMRAPPHPYTHKQAQQRC